MQAVLGSVRRECLSHVLALGERHLDRVLREYAAYFNQDRPHQALARTTPAPPDRVAARSTRPVQAVPILGGFHHAYLRAA